MEMHLRLSGFCLKIVIVCCVFAGIFNDSCAQDIPSIALTEGTTLYSIGNQVWLLKDSTGSMSIEEVIANQNSFLPGTEKTPSFGPTSDVIWCAFRVKNISGDQWYLEVGTPYLNEVDMYYQMNDKVVIHEQFGADYVYAQRQVATNQLIIPLRIPEGSEGRFFFRFKSRHTLSFPLRIGSMKSLYELNQRKDVVNGMYFGLLLALIIYNLFVFVALRDNAYLYYILYVLFLGLNIAYQRGYGFQFLWPNIPSLNSPNLFAGLATFATVLFTNAFLNTKENIPKLRLLHWIILIPLSAGLGITLLGYERIGFNIQLFTSMLLTLYVFVIGVSVYKKGFKPARYYLLGFGLLTISVLIFILKDLQVLPSTGLTDSSMQIGSAIEAVILSFALIDKFNVFKKAKEEVQARSLLQVKSFTEQLITTQELERKRLASELHDSIGQRLGIIKNKLLLLAQPKKEVPVSKIYDLTESVSQALEEVRNISYALRPVDLDLLGFTKAIENLVRQTSEASEINFFHDIANVDRCMASEAQLSLYRIIQECLNNILKHARASNSKILVEQVSNTIKIVIEDDGEGIKDKTSAGVSNGSGLRNMKERTNLLRGSFTIKDAVPRGTIIEISIPL